MRVILDDGTVEEYEDQPFAEGGQGKLYLSRDKQSVIKLYHQSISSRIPALRKIIKDFNVTGKDASTKSLFAWPNAIVSKPSLGVRMDNINARVEHKALSWWTKPKASTRLDPSIRGNWFDRTRVASQMANIAWKLHGSGLAHSDFSSDNFLANVARHSVVLIDLDALVVPDVLPPEMIGTTNYMAPEIVIAYTKGQTDIRPSIYTDQHSLAVLIYELLLQRHPLIGPKRNHPDAERDEQLALGERALYTEDPHDHSNRPPDPFRGAWLLGEEVEGLLRRAFTNGLKNPTQRPLAAEWGGALNRMADQIIPCGNPECLGQGFVLLRDHPAVCPWCGRKVAYPKQVPILRLYVPSGRVGHFQSDKGKIVGWQNRTLHRWHSQPKLNEQSATKEERAPIAEITFDAKRGGWLLGNLNLPDLRVADEGGVRTVRIGADAPLVAGQKWLLGAEPDARMMVVTMQDL
jgi:DNA-binding helix-hairpin-helix protein with protein kinase domain